MKTADVLMQQALSDNTFPGGVLLVSRDDRVVFFKAYGYADIFSKRAMTKDTIFDLASLTKPLATTLAVIMLIQENKLSLEQKLGSILSSFKRTEKDRIKIKHFLAHVSGLPDYRPYYPKSLYNTCSPIGANSGSLTRNFRKADCLFSWGRSANLR